MRAIMIQIVTVVGALLAGLTLAIVINKARREMSEAIDRRRRALLEPAVFEYLGAASSKPLSGYLPKRLSRRDRRLVEEILLAAARIVKGDTRDRITAALEGHGSVQGAIRSLRSRRRFKRADSAEDLGLMRSREAVEPLVALMNDPEPEVRIRAARALGIIRGTTSIRPLVRALADPSRWSAIRVAEILINVGAEAVDELLAAYETLPRHARISALDVLGRIRSLRAIGLMKRCLEDPDPDLRARAAHGLGLIGDSGTAPDLIKALADREWPVRAMAAKALGRIGNPAAIPSLREAMKDRQWWVRANSGEALRGLGQAGREALIDIPFARHMAVSQLEEGRIIEQSVSDLTSADPERRAAAIRFIDRVTASARVDERTRQAAEATQESVRRALGDVLKTPGPGDRGRP
ncbi:MAG: HEAT repeat domain-containing protein [Acidobacteria bacterium]|nr:HEAT repeat domain-containing protein [Acidobacteriota bacterium]